MAAIAPYVHIQCPCCDPAPSQAADGAGADDDDDDRAFDPRATGANYSLYPLEYLLYCEDCHQIRCPRCVAEEIVTYYCPNCLFEVPGSNIKSEGNRCTRSCFQCPICIGPLSVTALEAAPPAPALLAAENAARSHAGPYALTCSYCNWSSSEVGLKFEKPNGIYSQLQRLRNGGRARQTPKERNETSARRKDSIPSGLAPSVTVSGGGGGGGGGNSGPSLLAPISEAPRELASSGPDDLDVEAQFHNLRAFYQEQLSESNPRGAGAGLAALADLGFGSPGSLSRIMSLYTGAGAGLADKKAKSRVRTMREALDADEGLQAADLDEAGAVARLRAAGWGGTASAEQRGWQAPSLGEAGLHGRARLLDELRPIPYLLRTKRSKRCPACRHIISKPEAKVGTTRFRIRLVAGSYIPSISVRRLPTSSSSSSSVVAGAPAPATAPEPALLTPLKPVQFLLTFRNPIFEGVKVTLATPATTPGRFASRVIILCPQFDIDANTDVWDEALKEGDKDRRGRRGTGGAGEEGHHQAEPGKIWERGRNWVSIVVEVVPASLRLDGAAAAGRGPGEAGAGPLREDEDILEVPMFVRVEWEADAGNDDVSTAVGKDKDGREKREMAYWCVLGMGRISQEG